MEGIDAGNLWCRCHGDNITYTDWQRDNCWRAIRSVVGEGRVIGIEEDHLTLLQSTKPDAFLSPTSPIDIAMAGRNAMETEIARAFPDTEYRDTLVWFQSARNTDGATILLRHGSLSVATSCH